MNLLKLLHILIEDQVAVHRKLMCVSSMAHACPRFHDVGVHYISTVWLMSLFKKVNANQVSLGS